MLIGLNHLVEELDDYHEEMNINKLCQINDSEVSFLYFKSSKEIEPILVYFVIFFRHYPNKFIQYFLEYALQNSTILSLKEFVPIVWKPVNDRCCSLIDSIRDKSIMLEEVHKIYKKYVGKKEDVMLHLHLLYSALEVCHGREAKSKPEAWLEDAVNHMENYLALQKQSNAASLLLELKEKLNLSGDFTVVDTVAKQFVDSSRNQPLHSISSNLLSAVPFFREISTNTKKHHCIEAYCDCADIVKWIQKETKGINMAYSFFCHNDTIFNLFWFIVLKLHFLNYIVVLQKNQTNTT